jgi:hypothetical protein
MRLETLREIGLALQTVADGMCELSQAILGEVAVEQGTEVHQDFEPLTMDDEIDEIGRTASTNQEDETGCLCGCADWDWEDKHSDDDDEEWNSEDEVDEEEEWADAEDELLVEPDNDEVEVLEFEEDDDEEF